MNSFRIYVDASRCSLTKTGGYAYHITGQKLDISFSKAFHSTLPDPTSGEMMAILESIRGLKKAAKLVSGDVVHVYTDSINAIERIRSNSSKNHVNLVPHLMAIAEVINEEIPTGVKFKLHKVKAHVDDEQADRHEIIHNRVDKCARGAMRSKRGLYKC